MRPTSAHAKYRTSSDNGVTDAAKQCACLQGYTWESVSGAILILPIGCQVIRAGGGAVFVTSPTIYVQVQAQQHSDAVVVAANCGTSVKRANGRTTITVYEPLQLRPPY